MRHESERRVNDHAAFAGLVDGRHTAFIPTFFEIYLL